MAGPSLIATLGANISGFVRDLDTAKGHASSTGDSISALGGKLTGALSGIVSVAAIKAAITDAADYAGKIEDIHQRTDVSREALQAWDLVLSQNGSNVQAAVGFFEKLAIARQKAISGDDKAIKQFKEFGIDLDQLKDKSIRSEDLGMDIGKAFEKGDPQKLIASLRAIGGKSAGELIPSFRDGFAAAIQEAMDKGMSKTSVRELDKAGDAVTRAKAGFRAEVGEFSGTFLTRMRDFGDLFSGKLSFKDFITNRGAKLRDLSAGGESAPFSKADEEEEMTAEEKKKLKKEEEQIAKVRERTEELKRKGDMIEMTAAEKRAAINKEIEKLSLQFTRSDLEQAMKEQKIAELENERDRIKDKADDKEKTVKDEMPFKPGALEVNSLQRSGFFVGGLAAAPEFAIQQATQKSETHLAAIKKDIAKIASMSTSNDDDVQF